MRQAVKQINNMLLNDKKMCKYLQQQITIITAAAAIVIMVVVVVVVTAATDSKFLFPVSHHLGHHIIKYHKRESRKE
jgi:flagellar biosynthesis/type III secretory pathway M-ring protein FliF/YscJ